MSEAFDLPSSCPSDRLRTVADIEEALEAAALRINSCAVALDRMNLGGGSRDSNAPSWRLLTAYAEIARVVEALQPIKQEAATCAQIRSPA